MADQIRSTSSLLCFCWCFVNCCLILLVLSLDKKWKILKHTAHKETTNKNEQKQKVIKQATRALFLAKYILNKDSKPTLETETPSVEADS